MVQGDRQHSLPLNAFLPNGYNPVLQHFTLGTLSLLSTCISYALHIFSLSRPVSLTEMHCSEKLFFQIPASPTRPVRCTSLFHSSIAGVVKRWGQSPRPQRAVTSCPSPHLGSWVLDWQQWIPWPAPQVARRCARDQLCPKAPGFPHLPAVWP